LESQVIRDLAEGVRSRPLGGTNLIVLAMLIGVSHNGSVGHQHDAQSAWSKKVGISGVDPGGFCYVPDI
jgi:hypothetical protein